MRRLKSLATPRVIVRPTRDNLREVSARLSAPLGPARCAYLARVLAPIGCDLVIAFARVRITCTRDNVDAVVRVVGPLAARAQPETGPEPRPAPTCRRDATIGRWHITEASVQAGIDIAVQFARIHPGIARAAMANVINYPPEVVAYVIERAVSDGLIVDRGGRLHGAREVEHG